MTQRSEPARVAALAARVGLPLHDFQRRIVAAVFGPERETCVVIGKGNAKSTLGAILAVDHLLHHDRPHVVIGAASREQARVLFEAARDIALHPAIEGRIIARHLELRGPGGGVLRVASSDGKRSHGPTPSLSIIDELWAHRGDGLYVSQLSALVKRPDARLLTISTAAATLDSPLGRLRTRALAARRVERSGVVTDAGGAGLRYLEWSLQPSDDLDDPQLVKQANPAPWIAPDALATLRAALPPHAFAQFHCSIFGAGDGQWIPPGSWQACRADYEVEDGEDVWVGVDIGGTRDASAVVAVTADLRVADVTIFNGDGSVLEAAAHVRHLAQRYTIREVVYDPFRFKSEALRLEEDGLLLVEFPQTSRMIPASEGLHAAIVEQRLRHPGHPGLDAHIAAAIAKPSERGWRLVKSARDVQIDAAIALAMAVERAQARHAAALPFEFLGVL